MKRGKNSSLPYTKHVARTTVLHVFGGDQAGLTVFPSKVLKPEELGFHPILIRAPLF